MILTPAYGADYRSKAEVQKALDKGRDFIIRDIGHRYEGKPCNAADLASAGVTRVFVRYDKLRKKAEFEIRMPRRRRAS